MHPAVLVIVAPAATAVLLALARAIGSRFYDEDGVSIPALLAWLAATTAGLTMLAFVPRGLPFAGLAACVFFVCLLRAACDARGSRLRQQLAFGAVYGSLFTILIIDARRGGLLDGNRGSDAWSEDMISLSASWLAPLLGDDAEMLATPLVTTLADNLLPCLGLLTFATATFCMGQISTRPLPPFGLALLPKPTAATVLLAGACLTSHLAPAQAELPIQVAVAALLPFFVAEGLSALDRTLSALRARRAVLLPVALAACVWLPIATTLAALAAGLQLAQLRDRHPLPVLRRPLRMRTLLASSLVVGGVLLGADLIAEGPRTDVLGLAGDVKRELFSLELASLLDTRPSSTDESDPTPTPTPPPPARAAAPLVVLAGGDIHLGGPVAKRLGADPKHDPFARLAPLLDSADLRLASLVSPITSRPLPPERQRRRPFFVAPPFTAAALSRGRIDFVSVGSHHAGDAGAEGLEETLSHLERAKVRTGGATPQGTPLSVEQVLKAKGWSVAVLVFSAVAPSLGQSADPPVQLAVADPAAAAESVRTARSRHDLVLVSHHTGEEMEPDPSTDERTFVRSVLEAGADAVFAHGARVPRGIGWVGGRPAFYGLGSLLFPPDPDQPWTAKGYVARLTFRPEKAPKVEICPYALVDDEPRTLSGPRDGVLHQVTRRYVERTSAAVGGASVGDPGILGCMTVTAPE